MPNEPGASPGNAGSSRRSGSVSAGPTGVAAGAVGVAIGVAEAVVGDGSEAAVTATVAVGSVSITDEHATASRSASVNLSVNQLEGASAHACGQ